MEEKMDDNQKHKRPYEAIFKRPLDIIIALFALIVLCPMLLIIAILVRIKLGSPILFKQERPGKNEKVFMLYKFRSMSNAKDKDGNLLPDIQRLTRFGRFLRATSLDEIPELVNILKGDMSIVGPRPLSVIYLPYYTNCEHHRHDVRPGLTGLAQVNGRNSISWETKFRYDLDYVNTIGFFTDMKIVFHTIKKVFAREDIGQGEQAPQSLHIERADWLDEKGHIKEEYQE